MAVAINSKDTLARLLATENLLIEHKAVETAYFDPDNRVLTLPIWKDLTEDILTLLCAHEVSHALFSPKMEEFKKDNLPFTWINCVEDARVEKLIKKKYPGLSSNFYRGYQELFERNFFDTEDKSLSEFALIDRINLHFKMVPFVPFDEEEQPFIQMIEECETFDDVIEVVRALCDYCEEHEQDLQFEDIQPEFSDNGSHVEEQQSQQSSESSGVPQPKNEQKETSQAAESESREKQESGEREEVKSGGSSGNTSFKESTTDQAWTKKQSELIDQEAKDYVYLNIPDVDIDELVVSWKDVYKSLNQEAINLIQAQKKAYHWLDDSHLSTFVSAEKYNTFKKDSVKAVNYLVKEFEMRKSADEYRRSSVAKTGVIDTNTLHSYKWNEDIFKKLTITPGAKNHGLIFFLDWSGSMREYIDATLKQLYNLMWFCRKVQIPFDVYAFTEPDYHNNSFGRRYAIQKKDGDIAIAEPIRLFQFFSSEMNVKELDQQMKNIWIWMRHKSHMGRDMHMGGTPLIETIIASKKISERFLKKYKVQKLNLVFLTDGEANPMAYWVSYKNGSTRPIFNQFLHRYTKSNFFLRDRGYTYEMSNTDPFQQVETMLEWLKMNVDANIIGFRLANDRDARALFSSRCKIESSKEDRVLSEWKKTGSFAGHNIGGFEEYFIIRLDRSFNGGIQNIEVNESASKAQIKKAFVNHMRSKQFNKVILSKFASKIA